MKRLDSITDSVGMNLGEFWEMLRDKAARHAEYMGFQRVGHNLVTEQ